MCDTWILYQKGNVDVERTNPDHTVRTGVALLLPEGGGRREEGEGRRKLFRIGIPEGCANAYCAPDYKEFIHADSAIQLYI